MVTNLVLSLLQREQHAKNNLKRKFDEVLEYKTATLSTLHFNYNLQDVARSTFVICFSPDRTKIATSHGNHTVKISDCFTCKVILTLRGHPRTPWCVSFHPRINSILASGCLGGEVRLWNLNKINNDNVVLQSQAVISSLSFHPTDDILAISTHNKIILYDWNREEMMRTFQMKHHSETVRLVRFLPDGSKLITGIANVSSQYCKPEKLNVSTRGDPHGNSVVQTVSCMRLKQRSPDEKAESSEELPKQDDRAKSERFTSVEDADEPGGSGLHKKEGKVEEGSSKEDGVRKHGSIECRGETGGEQQGSSNTSCSKREAASPPTHWYCSGCSKREESGRKHVNIECRRGTDRDQQASMSCKRKAATPFTHWYHSDCKMSDDCTCIKCTRLTKKIPTNQNNLPDDSCYEIKGSGKSIKRFDKRTSEHCENKKQKFNPGISEEAGSSSSSYNKLTTVKRDKISLSRKSSINFFRQSASSNDHTPETPVSFQSAATPSVHNDEGNIRDRGTNNRGGTPISSESATLVHNGGSNTRDSGSNNTGNPLNAENNDLDSSNQESAHVNPQNPRSGFITQVHRTNTGRQARSEIWNFNLGPTVPSGQISSSDSLNDLDISVEGASSTIPVHGYLTFPFSNVDQSTDITNLLGVQTAVATATARSSHHVHTAVVIASHENENSETTLQTAVNRAIAGAFAGSGEGAVANNIIDTTHRLQLWDSFIDELPDIQDQNKNVIVPLCKIHNDSSFDVSQDGSYMAVFVPSEYGFPMDAQIKVISLKADSFLKCIYSRKFGPNAVSLSLSSLNNFLMVGLASRKLHWQLSSNQLIGQILQLPSGCEVNHEDQRKPVLNILHKCNQNQRSNVSVNTLRFHPSPGMGILYGTNRGHVQHCHIRPNLELQEKRPSKFPKLAKFYKL